MTARAAIYARVSTKEQAEGGTSLEGQLKRLPAHAESQGWTVVDTFADKGVSGDLPFDERPDAGKLMAMCRRGEIDLVVAQDASRFGRDLVEALLAEREIRKAGANLVLVEDRWDGRDDDRLTMQVQGAVAEHEKRKILARMKRGRRDRVRQGFWGGGPPPFGFLLRDTDVIVQSRPLRKLAIREEEAEVLRTAASLIVDDGLSVYAAAQALNGLGLRPRVGTRWTHQNLRRTLKDPILGGTWMFRCDDHEPDIAVPVPAILPPDRHTALLAALGAAALGPKSPSGQRFYLLSRGRLVGECGAAYHGIWRRDRESRAYRCNNRRPDAPADDRCSDQPVNADLVEEIVWAEITALLSDPDALTARAEQALGVGADDPEGRDSEIAKAEREIAALTQSRQEGVVQAMKAGLDAATMKAATDTIEAEIALVVARRDRLVALRDRADATADRAARLQAFAAHARERLATASPTERRELIDLLDVRVTIQGWEECPTCGGKGKVRPPCVEPGCTEPHYSRGFCRSHYWRERRGLEPQGRPPSGGEPCPTCRAMRRVPRLRIDGVVRGDLGMDTGEPGGPGPPARGPRPRSGGPGASAARCARAGGW
jgi:site-specific DNA recombinase